MAPRNSARINTPTEQNKADNSLVLYRLGVVEGKVDELSDKLDNQNFPTRAELKADLKEFQETIVTRFLDMKADLQKQIDGKASNSTVGDLKKQVYALMGFLSSIMLALVIAYLTTKGG